MLQRVIMVSSNSRGRGWGWDRPKGYWEEQIFVKEVVAVEKAF